VEVAKVVAEVAGLPLPGDALAGSLSGLHADIIAIVRPGQTSIRGCDRRRARQRRVGRMHTLSPSPKP
jgi:hypothetical protein